MDETPVERIQTRSGTPQTPDETIKEYVTRVGDEYGVESALVDEALSYVTEYYYSSGAPEEVSGFEGFLDALGEPAGGDTAGIPSRPAEDSTTGGDDPSATAEPTSGTGAADQPTADGPVVESPTVSVGGGTSRFKTGIQGREPRELALRFLMIATTAPVIGWMFARGWVPGNSIYDQGRALLVGLLGVPSTDATKLFVLFGFGVYLGLLTLLTIDVKKRVQAMLLWIGTLFALAVVASVGWVIPRVELTQLNVVGFVLGVVAGLVVELDQLRAISLRASSFRRPTLSGGDLPEFRYAASLLFVLLAVVVVATLGQVVLAGTVQVVDPIATVVFLVGAVQFVGYESETNYITLGPERSGKSMLMLGLCLTLLRDEEMHPDPNGYLRSSLERASNLQPGTETWPIPSTGNDELEAASFEVIAGYYFPRRLELTALDYAGQHLARIADLMQGGSGDAGADSVPQQVVDWVAETDTLLFVLDVERLVYPGAFQDSGADESTLSWGLEYYTSIVDGAEPDDVIVVATKCDILVDVGHVDPPRHYDSYADFRGAVTAHLTARPDVQELLATTGESTIHPLYFVTERHEGTYAPYLDGEGNLVPVGYDHLVEEMRARQ